MNQVQVTKTDLKKQLYLILWLILLLQIVALGKKMRFSTGIFVSAFLSNVAVRESLPSEVVDASDLINNHSIREFALSKTLENDPLFQQRIVDYNYPVRFNKNSLVVIAKTDEKEFGNCKVVDIKNSIGMYDCTKK